MMFQIYIENKEDSPNESEFRWRLIKKNNSAPIALSSEGFKHRVDCEANIHMVMTVDYATPIVNVDKFSSDKQTYTVNSNLNS